MASMNYFIQSLLEANEEEKPDTTTDDKAEKDDTPDDVGTEDTDTKDTDQDDSEENKEEDKDDTTDDDEGKEDDDLGDDFDIDPDGGEEGGDEEPPDGLTSPDDDGSSDAPEEESETNVQTNILKLSKLDRTLAKRKLFTNFQDLRTQTNTLRNIISNNEENVDPEIRDKIYDDLDKAYSSLTDYMMYKFSFINYEENFHSYLLFTKMLQDIVNYISNNATKNGKSIKL